MPRRASCQAASEPAKPPPMMVTKSCSMVIQLKGGKLKDQSQIPSLPEFRLAASHFPLSALTHPFSHRLRLGDGFLILAGLTQAAPHRAVAFGGLLDHKGRVAVRARLGHGTSPSRKTALRIEIAAVEYLAAARALFHDLALFAVRAGHPCGHRTDERPDVLALGISGAAEKLAVAAETELQRPAALFALLVY